MEENQLDIPINLSQNRTMEEKQACWTQAKLDMQ